MSWIVQPAHPPQVQTLQKSHTVSPFIGTDLLKATPAFIKRQTTQVHMSNFAMFVFVLLLDYCVFVAPSNSFAVQQLHLNLGYLNSFQHFG